MTTFSKQFGVPGEGFEAMRLERCLLPSADVPCSYDRLLTVFHEKPWRGENTSVLRGQDYRRMNLKIHSKEKGSALID